MKITAGEALWLVRRRLDMTVKDRAEQFGVSERIYHAYEDDTAPHSVVVPGGIIIPSSVARLSLGEYCALARRRTGKGMGSVAVARETSRMTVWKQEHNQTASTIELALWWRDAGPGYPEPKDGRAMMEVALPVELAAAAADSSVRSP